MSIKKVYCLNIAPLTPLPLTRSPLFSYRHDSLLPPGTLVQIPFGKRTLQGIVWHSALISGRTPLWLKPVDHVISSPWLNSTQQTIAQFISDAYFSSLGNTLKHFTFPLPKKISNETVLPAKALVSRKKRQHASKEYCVEIATDAAVIALLQKKIKQHSVGQGMLLILSPDLLLTHTLQQRLEFSPESTIVTLTSHLTPKELLNSWQKIRSGEAKIVLGTRQALFAPFTRIHEIIVMFPEERLSYKQWDMTPYYETSSVVRILARETGAKLTWLTTSLGLEEQYRFPKIAQHSLTSDVMMIDRRKDGKGARSKVFSKELEKILHGYKSNGKLLLLAKERGVAGLLICQACRSTARCPTCERVLGEDIRGHLRCLHCGYNSSMFPKCRYCGHMTFQSYNFGTVRVERELERIFPRKRLLRIDRDVLRTRAGWKDALRRLQEYDFDILTTTHEIGTLLPLPPLDLAVMLEGDYILRFPQFEGEERLILQIKRVIAKLKPAARLVAQTFVPEERVWRECHTRNVKALFSELLDERKLLGYPPVTAMIQVAPLEKTRLTQTERQSLKERLEAVVRPFPGFLVTDWFEYKRQGRAVTTQLVLRYPSTAALPATLITFLKRESHRLRIDVHPFRT